MAINPTGGMTTGAPEQGNPILFHPGSSAPTGSPGNMGFGNTANPAPPMPPVGTNPYEPVTTTTGGSGNTFSVPPPVSMNPGGTGLPTGPVAGESGQTLTAPNTFDQTGRQQNRTLQELQTYYGEGMGSMLYQYLQSGGGYNSAITGQAVNAQTQAMQHDIQMGFNTLGTNLAESGISPDSSVAALEKSNYMSQAVTQENAIAAQEYYNMWNASQNREAQMLSETGQVNATGTANQPTVLGDIGKFLGLGQTLAGGASAITSAISPGADTSFLDAFASM